MDKQTALNLYRVMRTIRRFEQRSTTLFGENKIWGTIHSYAGEEAIAAGVCEHLRDDDWITSTHRGHGHCIAKRAELGKPFPNRWGEALNELKRGAILKPYLGEKFIDVFLAVKRDEEARFHAEVTDRDYAWYLRVM